MYIYMYNLYVYMYIHTHTLPYFYHLTTLKYSAVILKILALFHLQTLALFYKGGKWLALSRHRRTFGAKEQNTKAE